MPHGYHGQIMHVDLTSKEVSFEKPEEGFYRKYMGGSALGMYYLLKHHQIGIDPLDAGNPLILSTSVMTGTAIEGQSRFDAASKSPLTGTAGSSQAGGFWPAQFKFTGFDAIVIQGKSEEPVYLWIHDGEVEFRSAEHLWGCTTGEVQGTIRRQLGDQKIEVLQCGLAGEKGVRFAALINDCTRANGRNGMGAVMGSKNLKAVAVRGKKTPSVSDQAALQKLAKWGVEHIPEGLRKYGTSEAVLWQQDAGGLPTRNYQSGIFEGAERISGNAMFDTILKERATCYRCPIGCKRVVEVNDEPYKVNPTYGGPEYETISTFGSYCGVDDLKAIALANELCNKYGMDTISCGATVAWAMECFERGLISLEDTDGIELRFGNADAMLRMVEKIASREGFGKLLGEGSARAAEQIGRGTDRYLITFKKQEAPAHMPRVKRSLALIYAVNPFGADHQSHEHDPAYSVDGGYEVWKDRMSQLGLNDPQPVLSLGQEKVRFALYTQWLYSALDCLTLCQFIYGPAWQVYGPDQIVSALNAVTGWDVSLSELLRLGERRVNMMAAFNAREGIGRESAVLPPRFFDALPDGPSKGLAVNRDEFEKALDIYYALAGWDSESGTPSREKLEELELSWVADAF